MPHDRHVQCYKRSQLLHSHSLQNVGQEILNTPPWPVFSLLVGCLALFYFYFLLSCMSCLHILEVYPLVVTWFANIFSHSAGSIVLLTVFHAVQKPFSLIRSHLFNLLFISVTLGDGYKKIPPWFMSKSVLPMFPSFSLIASHLTLLSLIHFEFIFAHGSREFISSFIRK